MLPATHSRHPESTIPRLACHRRSRLYDPCTKRGTRFFHLHSSRLHHNTVCWGFSLHTPDSPAADTGIGDSPNALGSLHNVHSRKEMLSGNIRCSAHVHIIFIPFIICSTCHFRRIALFTIKWSQCIISNHNYLFYPRSG